MTLEQDGEGEGVAALGENERVVEELPFLDLGVLVGAVVAMMSEGSFLRNVNLECGVDGLDV